MDRRLRLAEAVECLVLGAIGCLFAFATAATWGPLRRRISLRKAICLHCGANKRTPTQMCAACGFDPRGDPLALAKSYILSIERYEDGTDRKNYSAELAELADQIRAGVSVDFDEEELRRNVEIIELGEQIPWWVGVKGCALAMLWFAPVLLVIFAALVLLLFF